MRVGKKPGRGNESKNEPDSTRAGLASQRAHTPLFPPVFAILAQVLYLFYLLVVVQIALGLYSLWDGYQWFGLVRGRLSSHAGFYAPVTALICPCKGVEPGLEDNLTALTRFDYANYEIYFSLATSLDPALKIVERVKAASQRPVHIVIAGPAENCGEKVHNLRRAVESLSENFEVIVFTDSDVRLPKGWLTKLVAPLQNARTGATTAYRWIIPSRAIGSGGFASAMASAWNASVATLLGRARENFCWGGGTAIRKSTFNDVRALESWEGAISDDFALTKALEAAGRQIVFCPECLAATLHPWTGSSLLEFTNRQILITRVYAPRRWGMGAAAHGSYVLTLIFAAFVILVQMAGGDPWMNLALIAFVVPFLAVMKGVLRTIAADEMLPEWKAQLRQWSWVWTALAPVVPFLFAWNFIASLSTKRVRWRNIRYELVSPGETRILQR
ncbi:MAG TPA: glycosyltransferase family 2 protein [Candidatus Acidoferrales bacterium]|jgi:ceramide glucosyltransferase|nr:glycosyltransferase family 2 protein [Candidatus Acidoferrales bacterium]